MAGELAAIQALAPLLGGFGKGGSTKVTQTVSSLANVALSITNLTGGENSGDTGGDNTANPTATSSSGVPGGSVNPTYGAFSDTSITDTALAEANGISSVLNSKWMIYGAVGLVALGIIAAITSRKKKS